MKPYFVNEEQRIESLHQEAGRWIGTPFLAHSMLRGAGVDCVHLAAALYLATGAVKDFLPPAYSLDGGQHSGKSIVLAWMDEHPSFRSVYDQTPGVSLTENIILPGDLLCFRFGMSEHHVGVMVGGRMFVHAPIRRKVMFSSLSDPVYLRCLTVAYRPMEVEAP